MLQLFGKDFCQVHTSPKVGKDKMLRAIVKSIIVKPCPQTLSPKPPQAQPQPRPNKFKNPISHKGTGAETKMLQATTTQPLAHHHIASCTFHPLTFKHDGRVPQKNSKNRNTLEWSPLIVKQITGGQQEEGHGGSPPCLALFLSQSIHRSFLWYKIPSRMLGIKLYAVRYRCGQITSTTFIQHYSLKAHKVT